MLFLIWPPSVISGTPSLVILTNTVLDRAADENEQNTPAVFFAAPGGPGDLGSGRTTPQVMMILSECHSHERPTPAHILTVWVVAVVPTVWAIASAARNGLVRVLAVETFQTIGALYMVVTVPHTSSQICRGAIVETKQ